MTMREYYERQAEEARRRLRLRFEAADRCAVLIAPNEPSVRQDLWSHWDTPQSFAQKYPEWYQAQWGITPGPDFDWDAIDQYPWSYVQACLGLAGYARMVPATASPVEVAGILRTLKPLSASGGIQAHIESLPNDIAPADALHEAAVFLDRDSNLTLVQMRDSTWDGGYVIAAVGEADLSELMRLAIHADVFELGMLDLRAGKAQLRTDSTGG